MGFFDIFRRREPVVTRNALVDFLDEQSAFLTQKGLFEYSRARAGPYGNIMFDDKSFLVELERSRWLAFPVMIAMVGEVVEGALRPAAAGQRVEMLRGLTDTALATFDRYPAAPDLDAETWADLRRAIERDFEHLSFQPVKRVMDIPARFIDRYVAAMPIHEKLRAKDTPTIHNYLKANLCHVHETFLRRADIPALAAILTGPP
jgi:hypothetical protein